VPPIQNFVSVLMIFDLAA